MAELIFRVSAQDIRRAVKERVEGPIIALTKNPDVMRLIGERAIEIVTPYVPMRSGALRGSAYVRQTSRATRLIWGRPGVGKTIYYAKYQHDADDFMWKRHTPGTTSYWTTMLEPGTSGFEELIDYAEPLMKKEVQRGS